MLMIPEPKRAQNNKEPVKHSQHHQYVPDFKLNKISLKKVQPPPIDFKVYRSLTNYRL